MKYFYGFLLLIFLGLTNSKNAIPTSIYKNACESIIHNSPNADKKERKELGKRCSVGRLESDFRCCYIGKQNNCIYLEDDGKVIKDTKKEKDAEINCSSGIIQITLGILFVSLLMMF